MDEFIDFLQWPAMLVTLLAAYLIGSTNPRRRVFGFCTFIVSNALWIIWGIHDEAWALIALQAALCVTNVRGIFKNDKSTDAGNAGKVSGSA